LSYDAPYSFVYRTQEDIYLRQYTREEDDPDTRIVMDRSVEDLLECERDRVQKMLGDLE